MLSFARFHSVYYWPCVPTRMAHDPNAPCIYSAISAGGPVAADTFPYWTRPARTRRVARTAGLRPADAARELRCTTWERGPDAVRALQPTTRPRHPSLRRSPARAIAATARARPAPAPERAEWARSGYLAGAHGDSTRPVNGPRARC